MTMGDYRQLSDALFHAGADSGSQCEYIDRANRLHFYVLDLKRDRSGVLSYTIAVKSLDGAGPRRRGLALHRGEAKGDAARSRAVCTFGLDNTGGATGNRAGSAATSVDSDVYRLSARAVGRGWSAWLPNRLATAKAGGSVDVEVAVAAKKGATRQGAVMLTARSESDPHRTAKAMCRRSSRR
ncbi:Peptidase M6 OS=Streptomyces antimycoticus OX=68175 GN=SANT12839_087350 PE=4 SV=1 [Streptomyces antimycoticus]